MDAATGLPSEQSSGEGRLLLIYTQKQRAAALVDLLSDKGREVIACPLSAPTGHLIEDLEPSLVLLNPPSDRQELLAACSRVREQTGRPVVVLSEEKDDVVVAQAFAAGVDEYLHLPMADRELVARMDAMLRRFERYAQTAQVTYVGGMKVSAGDLSVERAGHKAYLSPIEFRLLWCLVSAPGKVLTHEALMSRVWGPEYVDSRHYLHLYIRYLREKLEDEPKRPKLILSEWGVGYRFAPPARAAEDAGQAPGRPEILPKEF